MSESGWKPVSKGRFEEIKASREKQKKEARFTARLSHSDFDGLKQIADRMGLGYQTLLGSIIHQYVTRITHFERGSGAGYWRATENAS